MKDYNKMSKEELIQVIRSLEKQIEMLEKRKKSGRKPVITEGQKNMIRELHEKGESYRSIHKKLGISLGSISNILKEHCSEN